MVLNNHKPYDLSESEDDDPWEIIGEETAPLAASQHSASVPHDVRDRTENNAERESHVETDDIGRPRSDSFLSAVSSITGDHRTVSDVEEGDDEVRDEEGVDAPEEREAPAGTLLDLPETLLGHRDEESEAHRDGDRGRLAVSGGGGAEERPAPSAPPMSLGNAERPAAMAAVAEFPLDLGDEAFEGSDSDDSPSQAGSDGAATGPTVDSTVMDESVSPGLVESLLGMGFEKENIARAIRDLRAAGAAEIDEDAVIGAMAGEAHDAGRTWDFVESTLRRRTQDCVRNIGLSAQRFQDNLRATCDEADARARSARDWTARAAADAKHSAASTKDSVCRANEKHGIAEKVATAAVVGGAALLALGNPRAAVGAVAVAGATLAAGEAMKESLARSGSTHSPGYGLGEGHHLD